MKKRKDIKFKKTGHIVVLDQSWHALFANKKTMKIKGLEDKLNKLLKEQGKMNTDYKGYKILKKQMMDEIVGGMDEAFNTQDNEASDQLKKNQKYIKDINNKVEIIEKKKNVIPEEIEAVNGELLKESMYICYERLVARKKEKSSLESEIEDIHQKVKNMVGKKEDIEEEINKLYNFMHDIAGIEIIEQFDQLYFGGDV